MVFGKYAGRLPSLRTRSPFFVKPPLAPRFFIYNLEIIRKTSASLPSFSHRNSPLQSSGKPESRREAGERAGQREQRRTKTDAAVRVAPPLPTQSHLQE